jgi:hypothetical protein
VERGQRCGEPIERLGLAILTPLLPLLQDTLRAAHVRDRAVRAKRGLPGNSLFLLLLVGH